jgi:glycosyltransferase involved in cell wall biosynthesis
MKILILSEPFVGLKDFFYGLTDCDAGQPAFYQVIKQLDFEGHEIVIITPTDYPDTKQSYLWTKVSILAYKSVLKDSLKLLERIRLGDLNLKFLLRVIQSVYFGLKVSRNTHFDLVIGHWEFATLAAFIVGQIRNIPNVSRLYGSNLIGRTGGNLNLKNILLNLNRVTPFITPASLYICTQDGTQADKAADYFNIPREKFLHVLNGVEREDTLQFKKASDTIDITFIGHLQSWKNPMRVLELVPEVTRQYCNVRFNFVGSGFEEANMRKYIEERHIESYVCLHGRLTQEEKNIILAKTDIYVSFYSYTNLCNTLLEALCYGKAVITLDEGDTSLVLKNDENAILLSCWDRDLALEKLLWLIDHPDKRVELGANALFWADKNLMSWEERAKVEIQYYQDVIQSTRL